MGLSADIGVSPSFRTNLTMTSKDAPRGTVKSVAGPGLLGTYKLVTIRRAHLPRHEVILSKAEARKILHIPSSRLERILFALAASLGLNSDAMKERILGTLNQGVFARMCFTLVSA
jgi:hypothetical protein